jgi:hypothetical protein
VAADLVEVAADLWRLVFFTLFVTSGGVIGLTVVHP